MLNLSINQPFSFKGKIYSSIEAFFESLPRSEIKIMDCLLGIAFAHGKGDIFPSQATLARYAGVTREWANKLTTKLSDMGLITKSKQRGFNKTCEYSLSLWFSNPIFRMRIIHLFPGLKRAMKMHNLEITTNLETTQEEKFTLYNDLYNHLVTSYTNSSSSTRVHSSGGVPAVPGGGSPQGDTSWFSTGERPAVIPDYVCRMPGPWTKAARCRFSVFPKEVIGKAMAAIRHVRNPKDIFGLVMSRCLAISEEMELAPDWKFYHVLRKAYGIEAGAPLVVGKKTSFGGERSSLKGVRGHAAGRSESFLVDQSYLSPSHEEGEQVADSVRGAYRQGVEQVTNDVRGAYRHGAHSGTTRSEVITHLKQQEEEHKRRSTEKEDYSSWIENKAKIENSPQIESLMKLMCISRERAMEMFEGMTRNGHKQV